MMPFFEACRYIVLKDRIEIVSEVTARRHRVLVFDNLGDATIFTNGGTAVTKISRAEIRLLARRARRAAWRRFWGRRS